MVFNRLVSFGEETNYGVAPADLSKWIGGVTSFNGGVETALEETVTLSGVRLRSYVVHGLDVRPSLEYYVQTGQFFKYALGSVSDSGTAPPYTHTIDISSGYDLPSISLLEHRIGNPQHGYLYTGAKVETVEVSWEEDSLLKASVEFLANNVSKVDTLPSVVPDTRGYFKASQKTVTINGTANEYVVSGSIRIANNHVRFPRKQNSVEKLVNQLRAFRAEHRGPKISYGAEQGEHDDYVISLALAVYAATKHADEHAMATTFWGWG